MKFQKVILDTEELVAAWNKAQPDIPMKLGDYVRTMNCPSCFTTHEPGTDQAVECFLSLIHI